MRNVFYIIVLFFSTESIAQYNLVSNASFENYSSCPSASNQLTLSVSWINPTSAGSPDYFNSCSGLVGVPYCCSTICPCFQYAKTGSAYAGLYPYSGTASNLREYIQTQFITPMTNGKCYYIGFYTNVANWCGLACNKLGAYLSNSAVNLVGPTFLLNYTSQVKSFNNIIIKDTLSWHLISGVFQAVNNEQFIAVGNFNNDATTDTLTFNSTALAPKYSYYFIDDVFVTPIDSILGGMPAFAGNNVTINAGDSTFIGQQISNLNCNWYNGTVQIASNTSGLYVKPVTNTTYVVVQTLCGNTTTASVVVTVLPAGTGINELEQLKNITVSPNPSTGKIFLYREKLFSDIEIKIYDVAGQLVFSDKFIGIKKELELNLENGLYFVELINKETNQRTVKKVIIQE